MNVLKKLGKLLFSKERYAIMNEWGGEDMQDKSKVTDQIENQDKKVYISRKKIVNK